MPESPLRILIADDERMSRVALKSMLEELGIEATLSEASDGGMMLESLEDFSPHVGIIDIRMPLVDGLKAIKKARSLSPDTRWIILSGFTEFEYAKHAVSLGVEDYLVKPVSPDRLKRSLTRARDAWEDHIVGKNAVFEEGMTALFGSSRFDARLIRNRDLTKAVYAGALLCIDDAGGTDTGAIVESTFQNLKDRTFALGDNRRPMALLRFSDDRVLFVTAAKKTAAAKETLDLFLKKTQEFRKDGSLRITAFKAVSDQGPERLHQLFVSGPNLATMRLFFGSNREFDANEAAAYCRDNPEQVSLSRLIVRLMDLFWSDEASVAKNEREHAASAITANARSSESKPGEANIAFAVDLVGFRTGGDLDSSEGIEGIAQFLKRPQHSSQGHPLARHIDEVMDYVAVHYGDNIGINTIAPMIGLTPNYLSSLFHEKTGVRFARYLAEYRIEKAKDLLALTDMFIKDIAVEVGYRSVRHFTNTFIDHVGRHPTEYRQRLQVKS